MSENKAIWDGWYSVAGPVNKFCVWVTIGLGVLAWLVYSDFYPPWLVWNIWILICPVVAAILYLLFVQKAISDKDIGKKTQIWLLICTIVGCIGYFWAAALIVLQFVMVCILSEKPIWVAFGEK
jgi:Na+/serine symporter